MLISYLDLGVVLVYFVGITLIGLLQAKRIRGSGDYFAGGRKFNKFFMMMHNLGTSTHADDPVSVVGACSQMGFSGIWYTFIYLPLTPFFWIWSPIFRRLRYLTMSDMMEARFGRKLAILYTLLGTVYLTVVMGTILKGTGTIVTSVTDGQFPEWIAALVMSVVFVAYGTSGGLVATVVTESIQGLLIVVMSLLLVPFAVIKLGGFDVLHQTLPSTMFTLTAAAELSLAWIIAASLSNAIGWVSSPMMVEINSSGKTEWENRIGATYGIFIKRLCALGWAVTGVLMAGLLATNLVPGFEHRENAFGMAMKHLLPPGFFGLMVAAIFAAQMAALSAFMVGASGLFARNLYKVYVRPQASDADIVRVARWAGLVTVVFAVLFSIYVPGVAAALTIQWEIIAMMGVFIWGALIWRRVNAPAAITSLLIMFAIWLPLGPVGIWLRNLLPSIGWLGMYGDNSKLAYLTAAYLPIGIVALVIVSLLTKPFDRKKLDGFYLLLRTPVGHEDQLIEAGVDIIYAGHTKGHPWEMKHGRLVNILGWIAAAIVSAGLFGALVFLSRLGK